MPVVMLQPRVAHPMGGRKALPKCCPSCPTSAPRAPGDRLASARIMCNASCVQKDSSQKEKVESIKETAKLSVIEAQRECHRLAEAAASSASGSVKELQITGRLQEAIEHMQAGLVERDTEVRLLLLATLSGEHILFIGPPGTAKSELGQRLSRLCKGVFFQRLLTRYTVPEELFGPLSMKALEEDKYKRKTNGYLPDADVAFIDEIFKANSAILNTLLTILNERLFDNGPVRVQVPLLCLVGASNELPESEELDALYDRFLLRRRVQQASAAGLTDLLAHLDDSESAVWSASVGGEPSAANAAVPTFALNLSHDQIQSIRADAMREVSVPDQVKQLLIDLRTYLQEKCEPQVYVSDRRLMKAVKLLKVAAYTSGRSSVSLHDCLLLQHVLWQRPEESDRIADFIMSQLASDEKSLEQFDYIFKGIFARACQAAATNASVDDVLAETQKLRGMLAGKLTSIYTSVVSRPETTADSIWCSGEEMEAVAAAVLPKLEQAQAGFERLLYEVATLEAVLKSGMISAYNIAMVLPSRWEFYMKNI